MRKVIILGGIVASVLSAPGATYYYTGPEIGN